MPLSTISPTHDFFCRSDRDQQPHSDILQPPSRAVISSFYNPISVSKSNQHHSNGTDRTSYNPFGLPSNPFALLADPTRPLCDPQQSYPHLQPPFPATGLHCYTSNHTHQSPGSPSPSASCSSTSSTSLSPPSSSNINNSNRPHHSPPFNDTVTNNHDHDRNNINPHQNKPSQFSSPYHDLSSGTITANGTARRPSRASSLIPNSSPDSAVSSNRKLNVLHRNKACLCCRARKTKCDAARPICSSCKRLPPEQQAQCKYDQPPKWLENVVSSSSHAQAEKRRVAELQTKLEALRLKFRQLKIAVTVHQDTERKFEQVEQELASQKLLEQQRRSHQSQSHQVSAAELENQLLAIQAQPTWSDQHYAIPSNQQALVSEQFPVRIPSITNSIRTVSADPYPSQPVSAFESTTGCCPTPTADQLPVGAFSQPSNTGTLHQLFPLIGSSCLQSGFQLGSSNFSDSSDLIIQLSEEDLIKHFQPQSKLSLPINDYLDPTATSTYPAFTNFNPSVPASIQFPDNFLPATSAGPSNPGLSSPSSSIRSNNDPVIIDSISFPSPLAINQNSSRFEPTGMPSQEPLFLIGDAILPEQGVCPRTRLPSDLGLCKKLVRAFLNRPLMPFSITDSERVLKLLEKRFESLAWSEVSLIHVVCAIGARTMSAQMMRHKYWIHAGYDSTCNYHLHWSEVFIDRSIQTLDTDHDPANGCQNLIDTIEASILCSQHYKVLGSALLMWRSLGLSLRLCTLLGLNYETRNSDPYNEDRLLWCDGSRSSCASAQKPITRQVSNARRLLWWYTFCCDRMCASAAGFAVSAGEADGLLAISDPNRSKRLDELDEPGSHTTPLDCHNPLSARFLFEHDVDYGEVEGPDRGSLELLIKSAILLGRVTTLNYRQFHPLRSTEASRLEANELSGVIQAFFRSIPNRYQNPFKFDRAGRLDATLLSMHALVRALLIELYENSVQTFDDPAMQICIQSSRTIVDWLQQVVHQQIDIGCLLCSNPTFNYALSCALKTQCRIIAFQESLGQTGIANALRQEVEGILTALRTSRQLPMSTRNLDMFSALLTNVSVLLPSRADFNINLLTYIPLSQE